MRQAAQRLFFRKRTAMMDRAGRALRTDKANNEGEEDRLQTTGLRSDERTAAMPTGWARLGP
jgi:hypothetical protein